MPVLFTAQSTADKYGPELRRIGGDALDLVLLGEEEAALSDEEIARIEGAYFAWDLWMLPNGARRFFGVIRRAQNLRWLHLSFVGTDGVLFQELMDRGVTITNSAGASAEPIALTVLGAMLSLYRRFPRWSDAQRRHAWEPLPRIEAPDDLRGQTLTIVGLGAIGTHLAHFARPLGMHIVGVRRRPAGINDGVDEWLPPERLAEVLPRTDWLVLAVPLTTQTRGLVDAAAIAALPAGAHILNVARGAVVDEQALVEALRSGHLGGAYLDVFTQEPLDADSPLWDLPNVIISPHDASPSRGNAARADAMFLEELACWVRGRPFTRAVSER